MKAGEVWYFAKSYVLQGCSRAEARPWRSWLESRNIPSPTQEPHKCVNLSLSGGLDPSILDSSGIFKLSNLNNLFWN